MSAEGTPEVGVKVTADTTALNAAASELAKFTDALKKASGAMGEQGKHAEHAHKQHSILANMLHQVGHGAEHANHEFQHTASHLLTIAAGATGVWLGMHELAEAVIESNEALEKMEKQIGGNLFAFREWRAGVDAVDAYTASLHDAEEMRAKLEEAESRFAVPMEKMGEAMQTLIGPLSDIGIGEQKILELSEQTGAAMRVFGGDAGQMASTLSRLLGHGMISQRATDPFTSFLRHAVMGLGDLRKAKPADVLSAVSKAMASLEGPAEKATDSLDAALFRLKDFTSDTLRDITGPSFRYLVKGLTDWQHHITTTTVDGKTLAEVYSGQVLDSVKSMTEYVGMAIDHWKLLAGALFGVKAAMMGWNMVGILSAGGAEATALITKFQLLASAASAVGGAMAGWKIGEHLLNEQSMLGSTFLGKGFRGFSNFMGQVTGLGGPSDMDVALSKAQNRFTDRKFRQFKAVSPMLGPLGAAIGPDGIPTSLAKPDAGELSSKDLMKPGQKGIHATFTGPISIKQDIKTDADPDNIFQTFRQGLEGQASKKITSSLTDTFGGSY